MQCLCLTFNSPVPLWESFWLCPAECPCPLHTRSCHYLYLKFHLELWVKLQRSTENIVTFILSEWSLKHPDILDLSGWRRRISVRWLYIIDVLSSLFLLCYHQFLNNIIFHKWASVALIWIFNHAWPCFCKKMKQRNE